MRGLGNLPFGSRHTPGVEGAPNAEPVGALSGAPPRTALYRRLITGNPQAIVTGTPENRTVTLVPPLVGWTIYVGDASVSPASGIALIPGLNNIINIPGLQDLWAVTDAPIALPLSVQIAIVLMAEQQRRVG